MSHLVNLKDLYSAEMLHKTSFEKDQGIGIYAHIGYENIVRL